MFESRVTLDAQSQASSGGAANPIQSVGGAVLLAAGLTGGPLSIRL